MWTTIPDIIKVLLYLIGLFVERNSSKAKKKAEIGKEIINVFAETDKKTQASALNDIVGKLGRM